LLCHIIVYSVWSRLRDLSNFSMASLLF